jgi:ElaB/YqjD/DUF883 family membrane-anchored ribosome-binding protein
MPDTATLNKEATVTKEKLAEDLRLVIADAEELLRATAGQAGEKFAATRQKVQESIERARVELSDVEDLLTEHGKQAVRVTDDYVRSNPWQSVGIAAGIGIIIGVLISRR